MCGGVKMARKSRKHLQYNGELSTINNPKNKYAVPTAAAAPKEKKLYRTAIYARLSRERQKTEAIETQIEMVKEYIAEHEELRLVSTKFDNGISGTHFNRPAFLQLMEQIKDGEIDCVVIKDLSRFGRNLIMTGDYIDKIFPFLGVRLVSIMDNFDSNDVLPEDMIITNFKNFAHAHFAKETSRKVISAKRELQEKGEYIGNCPCYGYLRSPADKYKLVIDEEVAPIVKEIFFRFVNGETKKAICDSLNSRKVPTPSQYKSAKYGYTSRGIADKWGNQQISHLLVTEMYVGNLVQHKTEMSFYDNIPQRNVPTEMQCRVDGIVPQIIDTKTWKTAQKMVAPKYKAKSFAEKKALSGNIFRGLIFCKECGYRIQIANNHKNNIKYQCPHCKGVKIDFAELSETVKTAVKAQIKLAIDFDLMLKTLPKADTEKENIKIKRQITIIENCKVDIFGKYADGNISEAELLEQYAASNAEILALENRLLKNKTKANTDVINRILHFKSFRKLTEEIISTFISKIVVSADNKIEIVFKFSDILGKISKFINGGESSENI
jgi:DNA invertase Pin-like site-specific DNA recombinase/Zn finger protein HypA/HybF involved in hydrogenase expression